MIKHQEVYNVVWPHVNTLTCNENNKGIKTDDLENDYLITGKNKNARDHVMVVLDGEFYHCK